MTVPTLTPRAAREQTTFRKLLHAMSRPGSVSQLELQGADPFVVIAEALVDHEVTFAIVPDQPELTEAILRQTGSHAASLAEAQYVFCDAASLEAVLQTAADGTWEYPDAGAMVVCRVPAIVPAGGSGETLTLSGPGIRDRITVSVDGFSQAARRAFAERNALRPLGLDLAFVAGDGSLVCLSRYTQLQEE